MNQIKAIQRLNQQELEQGISTEASWHAEFKETAYIFFGSLPFELTEGDLLIIFSQYGIPVHLKLIRDKETGKSRGFGYLKYEDQRSTILAVDNLNGAKVLGRLIRVNHCFYEEKEYDEEYETRLREELRNDFASEGEEEEEDDIKQRTAEENDEFRDPLLLMGTLQKESRRQKHHSSHKHRSHRHSTHESVNDK